MSCWMIWPLIGDSPAQPPRVTQRRTMLRPSTFSGSHLCIAFKIHVTRVARIRAERRVTKLAFCSHREKAGCTAHRVIAHRSLPPLAAADHGSERFSGSRRERDRCWQIWAGPGRPAIGIQAARRPDAAKSRAIWRPPLGGQLPPPLRHRQVSQPHLAVCYRHI